MILNENTLLGTIPVDEFVKDKQMVATVFWVNMLGFLGLKNHAGNSAKLNSYFKKDSVRLDAITVDSGDLTFSIKLAVDAGLMTTAQANALTRMLALIKQGKIDKIDENILRANLTTLTKLIQKTDPLIKPHVVKFLDASETLADVVRSAYKYARKSVTCTEFVTLAKALLPSLDDGEPEPQAAPAPAPEVTAAAKVVKEKPKAQPTPDAAATAPKAPAATTDLSLLGKNSAIPRDLNTAAGRRLLAYRLWMMPKKDAMAEFALWNTGKAKPSEWVSMNSSVFFHMTEPVNLSQITDPAVLQFAKELPVMNDAVYYTKELTDNLCALVGKNSHVGQWMREKYMQFNFDPRNADHLNTVGTTMLATPDVYKPSKYCFYSTGWANAKKSVAKVTDTLQKNLNNEEYIKYFWSVLGKVETPKSILNFYSDGIRIRPITAARHIFHHVIVEKAVTRASANCSAIVNALKDIDLDMLKDMHYAMSSTSGCMNSWKKALKDAGLLGKEGFIYGVTADDFDEFPEDGHMIAKVIYNKMTQAGDYPEKFKALMEKAKGDLFTYFKEQGKLNVISELVIKLADAYTGVIDALLFGNVGLTKFSELGFDKPEAVAFMLRALIPLSKNTSFNIFNFVSSSSMQPHDGVAWWAAKGPDHMAVLHDFAEEHAADIFGDARSKYIGNVIVFMKWVKAFENDPLTLWNYIYDSFVKNYPMSSDYKALAETFSIEFFLGNDTARQQYHDLIKKKYRIDMAMGLAAEYPYLFVNGFPMKKTDEFFTEFASKYINETYRYKMIEIGLDVLEKIHSGKIANKPEWVADEIAAIIDVNNVDPLMVMKTIASKIDTYKLSADDAKPLPKWMSNGIDGTYDAIMKINLIPGEDLDNKNPLALEFISGGRAGKFLDIVRVHRNEQKYMAIRDHLLIQTSNMMTMLPSINMAEEVETIPTEILAKVATSIAKRMQRGLDNRGEFEWLGRALIRIYEDKDQQAKLNDVMASFSDPDRNWVRKIVKDHLLVQPLLERIAGSQALIRPEVQMDQNGLAKVLKFNNFDLMTTRMPIRKNEDELAYFNRVLNKTDADAVDVVEPKVTKIETTADELEVMSAEFYKYYSQPPKHGNVALKITDAFNVNLDFPEFEVFKQNHPDTKMFPVFHGTGTVAASMILRFGFRVINKKAATGVIKYAGRMLGDGIYFATNLDKSAQYVGDNTKGNGVSRHGQTGYIFEMEAYLGEKGVDYESAGLGKDSIRSPEWCVFNPRAQVRIVRAFRVEMTTRAQLEAWIEKHGVSMAKNESKYFPKFAEYYRNSILNEGSVETDVISDAEEMPKYTGRNAIVYHFLDGRIPVSDDRTVTVDEFIDEFESDDCYFFSSPYGVSIQINTDADVHGHMVVPNVYWFRTDPDGLYSQFKFLLDKAKKK